MTTAQDKIDQEAAEILRRPYTRELVPYEGEGVGAKIAEFPACVAQGDTPTEALEQLERVALSWLAACLEQGTAVPPPREEPRASGRFALRMPRSLHAQVVGAAERDGVSVNQFIVHTLAARVGIDIGMGTCRARSRDVDMVLTHDDGTTVALIQVKVPSRSAHRWFDRAATPPAVFPWVFHPSESGSPPTLVSSSNPMDGFVSGQGAR